MSMMIIEGRNNGYPCIGELSEDYTVVHKAPFWDFVMKLSPDRNNGYPCLVQIPVPARETEMKPAYPDFFMHCLGEEFNCGYPCILKLENIRRSVFSNVFFGNSKGIRLFFGGKEVDTAFCNNRKVYGRTYVSP